MADGKTSRLQAIADNWNSGDNIIQKGIGAMVGGITGKSRIQANRDAKTQAEMTQVDENGNRRYVRNAQGDIVNRETGQIGTTNKYGHVVTNDQGVPDVALEGQGIYANSQEQAQSGNVPQSQVVSSLNTQKADNDYTLQDIINEVGDDKDKVREWLSNHPGYEIGDKTRAYLSDSEGNNSASQPSVDVNGSNDNSTSTDGNSEVVSEATEAKAEEVTTAESPKEQAEALSDQLKSKKAKADVRAITNDLWSAYENGEFGDPDSADAKKARNYFLLNELMTSAKNWSKVESNYIENLSRAAHGDTIKATDTDSFEKSRFEQMRDNAFNRYEQAKQGYSDADVESANEASDIETKQQIAETQGPQGLAQAASTVQAEGGNFDPLTQAMASGDPNQLQKVLDAAANEPITAEQMNQLQLEAQELENKFNQQSFQSRLDGLVANNKMTQAQASLLLKKVNAIGGIETAMSGLANGTIDGNSLMKAGLSFAELKLLSML